MANSGVVVVVSGQDDTGKVFEAIEKNLHRTTEAAHETENALGQLGERAKRYLEYVGIALGVRETVDALKEVVVKSAEFGETLNKTSQRTGLAVETLSTLHYATGVMGEDFDGAAKSVGKLAVTLGEAAEGGNKKALSVFQALGLNATDLAKRQDGVETAFKRVSEAMSSGATVAQKAVIAKELLGRAGQQEIALLSEIGSNWDEYREKAKAAGVFMTAEQAAKLEELNRKLQDMKQHIEGDTIAVGEGLAPALEQMFSVISGGKPEFEAMREFGEWLGRFAAGAGALIYGLVSDFELLTAALLRVAQAQAYINPFGPTASYFKQLAEDAKKQADIDAQKGADLGNIAIHGPKKEDETAPRKPGGNPPKIPDLTGDAGADKLDAALKARDAARTRLAEQTAQLQLQITKASLEQQAAQLEDDHARSLVSDAAYYQKKLAIEKAGLDAQRQAAIDKQKEIDSQIVRLQDDAKKHSGNAKERATAVEDETKILELRTERLKLDGEIAKINGDIAKAEIESAQKVYEFMQKQAELVDEMAAKREAITGGSVEARLHQSADAYDIKRAGLVADFGEGSKEVSDADFTFQNEQDHIRATGAEETAGLDQAKINARRQAVQDAVDRGQMSALDAQRQKIALDHEEAQALEPVLAAYQQLAEGGDLQATEKVIELQQKISELQNPVDEVAQHMRESFDGAFEGLFENMDTGLKGLENFAKDVQRIFEQAAYKKLFEPFIQGELGKLIPNVTGAPGTYGDAGVGGVHAIPANPGTDIGGGAVKAAASIGSALGIPGLGGLDKKGGAGTITIVLENESGLPLKLGDIKPGGNVDRASVEAIIKDSFEDGGLMRSLLTGFHV